MTSEAIRKITMTLLLLGVLWAAAYLWSISILLWTEPTGDGFTRGLNRLTGFLGWQFVAGVVAIVVFVIGRRLPKGGRRWLSRIPLILASLPFVLAVAALAWGWTQQLLFAPQTEPGPISPPDATAPAVPTD